MGIAESWARIAKWHKANTPSGTFSLAKGASERQVAKLESTIGEPLPAELRESYMLHDGTAGKWLLFYGELMPISDVEGKWKRYFELQEKIG